MRKHLQRGVAVIVAAVAVVLVPRFVFGWGEVGHRIVGEAAALKLPPSAPTFLRDAAKQLGYLNPEPDRWRSRAESSIDPALDRSGAPEHFIDLEMAPPAVLEAALKARDRFGYLDTLRAAHIDGVVMGLLPFKMLEMSQQLREDFRQWRAAPDSVKPWVEARIIDAAGILGHYVADGANPAHTTIQYNGWTGPNPNGYATDRAFHARFESGFVTAQIKLPDVLAKLDTTAQVLPDLRSAIIAYLKVSNSFVEPMYRVDKAHPFDSTTTNVENKAFAVDRLAAGARMLRDIWWTAYVTSAPSQAGGR
jgi:hypothetical protein